MDTVHAEIKDLKKTNTVEHTEIRNDVKRMLQVGWGVLGGVLVGVVVLLVGSL